jgi:PKD repeat protein
MMNLSMEAQVQNTYTLIESHDHESLTSSVSNPDNHVVASTLTDPLTGDKSIHVMEVDNLGAIIWEAEYNTPDVDRVFHIGSCPQGAGYYLTGYTRQGAVDRLLVIELNAGGGIINQAVYNDPIFGANSYGLHITKSVNDPQPGYVIAGFETVAPMVANQKQALILKLDGALNVQWSRHIDTPGGNWDFDMGSHVVEANDYGYFLTGSSNRTNQGDQIILAAMFDYAGNPMWQTAYDDNGGNGHYSVGASAYYDPSTKELYQLSNLSIIHHFGVNVFDVATGARIIPKSYGVFSNLGYYNIQGFRIMESQDPNNLIIAGYMRDHYWGEDTDEDGIEDQFFHGSVPFAMEVDKNATAILWDNIYLVPSAGYNNNVDIFSAFSAGQQPRILHPEMAWRKLDDQGYVLAAYRGMTPDFATELIELDLVGDNNCSRSDVALQFYARNWHDYQDFVISGPDNTRIGSNLVPNPINSNVTACSVGNDPCIPNPDFTVTAIGDCCYIFSDNTPAIQNIGCDEWIITDAGGLVVASGSGDNFTYCFPISGTYTICYTDCCIQNDGTVVKADRCQTIDVSCCDPQVSVLATQQGCYYTFTITNISGVPDADICIWTDLFGTVTLPFSWTQDFTGYCGPYGICYAAYCCADGFDPNQTPTVCADWYIDCCGNCTPDANFDWNVLADCCYEFYDLTPDGTNCDYWDIYDPFGNLISSVGGESLVYCFPYTGNFTVCYNDCCTNADGTIALSTYCKNVEVDCGEPCEMDANFAWVDLGQCCYQFYDLTPDPTQVNNCDYWEIYDQFYNLIASGSGDDFTHCFTANGLYHVCFHDCCMTADGAMYFDDICMDIEVNCGGEPCVPNADFIWSELQGCCYQFQDITPDPNAGFCDKWEIFDPFGTLIATGSSDNFVFCFPGTGNYRVCYTDCCVNADGTINNTTLCKDIWVDCGGEPCVPNADFIWTDLQDCCYLFQDVTPDPNAEFCDKWEIFDQFGNLIVTASGDNFTFCFPGTGNYHVCYTDCCVNADGTTTTTTLCKDIWVDCGGGPCVPDAHFTWNELQDCCYEFYDLTPDPINVAACDRWDIYDVDGNVVVTGFGDNFSFCFGVSGTYTVCYTDCCVNPDGTINTVQHCQTIDVACCDPQVQILVQQQGCYYTYTIVNISATPDAEVCVWTDLFGVVTLPFSWTQDFTGYCGLYGVCYGAFCCSEGYDPAVNPTLCVDWYIDCCEPCTPDADFQWNEVQDCCYEFYDLTPDPNAAGNCDRWDIYDPFWNLLASGSGDNFVYCFPGTGSYIVCYTDCCVNPDGTVNQVTLCKDIWVDCGNPCVPDADFIWNELHDCCYEFQDLTPDPAIANNCDKWEIFDQFGNLIASAPGDNFIFCFPGTGNYIVCYTDCCVNPNGTTNSITICKDIWVDCGQPCIPDANFTWLAIDNCCYNFFDLTPSPAPGLGCEKWEVYDQLGNLIAANTGSGFVFCFPTSGVYTVCYTDCCVNADGTIILAQSCQQIQVQCGCEPVPAFDWEHFPDLNADNCEQGFCITTPLDPTKYCATWSWGDGIVENYPVNVCPTHIYECDGIYNVCVTVFCCEDPSVQLTVCKDIDIDCPCTIPADVNFTVAYNQDNCDITALIHIPDVPCPDELCWTWDFGDGTVVSGGAIVNHTYTASGVYNVCLNVFCCDDPSIGYSICYQVQVNCGCAPIGDFSIDAIVHGDPCGEAGFCPIFSFDVTGYCAVWDFGDGTTAGPFVGPDMLFCPIHTYDCAGVYDVCLTLYCCDDPSISVTKCIPVQIDCGCKLPSVVSMNYVVDDNCTTHLSLASSDDYCGDICVSWDFGDGTSGSGWTATHNYATSGVYTVCVTVFCCNDPSESFVICQEIYVDCGCAPIGDFSIDAIVHGDPCGEAGFCPIFSFDVTGYCAVWDFGDGTTAGPFVGPDMLFCPIHTYDCAGVYNVCLTIYCCDDPSISVTKCIPVQIDCGCKLPSSVFVESIISDDCTATFNILSTDDYCGDICVTWDFGDGTTGSGWTATHTYTASGVYTVCAKVFCCNDPTEFIEICTEVQIHCQPCTPDPLFELNTYLVNINGECFIDVYANLLTHDGEPDVAGDACDSWQIYDGLGNLILVLDGTSYGNGWDMAYILPAGCYTICRVECCVNPDGTVTQATHCIDFCEECPCEVPQFDWQHFPDLNTDNCEEGFCITTMLDPTKYCATWSWGDGTVENYPVDVCPTHVYACDGVYEVCVTVYCCADPSQSTTVCKNITVDCPCNLPANIGFNWTYGQDMCTVFANINLPAVVCPDEICWTWDFGDGTTQVGGTFASHTYSADGLYNVCLYVHCCDDPAVGYVICQPVQIDCGGCPEPCEIFPYFMPVAGDCNVYFFNFSQAGSFTTITGYLWDFGDGTTSTSFDPVHSFPDTGTYTVCLTVYGSSADGNCEQTFCWDVTVDCDPPCPGDTNGDGVINTADLMVVLSSYGQSCP